MSSERDGLSLTYNGGTPGEGERLRDGRGGGQHRSQRQAAFSTSRPHPSVPRRETQEMVEGAKCLSARSSRVRGVRVSVLLLIMGR